MKIWIHWIVIIAQTVENLDPMIQWTYKSMIHGDFDN